MAEQINNNGLYLDSYKILADLLKHDENLFWKRNEFIFTINGGLLTVLALIQSSKLSETRNLGFISFVICFMGFLINILWFLVAKRSEAFYNHWYDQLIVLENEYLKPINIFQIAAKYFEKGEIVLGGKKIKLDYFSRVLRIFTTIQVLSMILIIVWFALAMYLIL